MKYLALGDSYTVGEGVGAAERWPVLLAQALRDGGVAIDDPRIIATTGWTTDELADAIDAAGPLGQWDFVTLLAGVNNQYRGRALDEYREQFEALLHRAIALAGGRCERVMVLSIPDWGVTRFGAESGRDLGQVSRDLDAFNDAARATSARHGVAFVDIAPVSRARGGEPAMQADDGLHPSAAMHALWLREALPVAQRLLSDTEPD
jgi:lysophospholipase L1-like esterase